MTKTIEFNHYDGFSIYSLSDGLISNDGLLMRRYQINDIFGNLVTVTHNKELERKVIAAKRRYSGNFIPEIWGRR